MEENTISAIIVNPRSERLYNYWINGSDEKRSMLKERMREFCLDLSPKNAREINRCINELLPFVIFVDQQQFQELVEQSPPPLPKASLFPLRKKVYSHKFEKQNEKSPLEEQQRKFNIWVKYGIFLDKKKQPKERKLL